MIRKLLILLLVLKSVGVSSQTIELYLPSCKYLQYHFALIQGTKLDTIAVGRFDDVGKALFSLDEKYADHVGVGELTITGSSQKWNVILNGEDKIKLTETKDDKFKVTFDYSTENIALNDYIKKYVDIMQEYQSANLAVQGQIISPVSLPAFRLTNARQAYEDFLVELRNSPLYAAKMLEIMICLIGDMPTKKDPNEISRYQKEFISNTLDIATLYSSNFWDAILAMWVEQNAILQTDEELLTEARYMLERTKDITIRRELTNAIILMFSRWGKDDLLMKLGTEYLTIPMLGMSAPSLEIGTKLISPKNCLIIFYDSSCGLCHNELYELRDHYELLSNEHNQIEVISVSADTNMDIFHDTIDKFPWKVENKLCDRKGFEGSNFRNYGVVGTPTIILVDKEGIIRGRYVRLRDFLK